MDGNSLDARFRRVLEAVGVLVAEHGIPDVGRHPSEPKRFA